jgi:hypothetical protein
VLLALLATGLVATVLAAPVAVRAAGRVGAGRGSRARNATAPSQPRFDPGRERRAEQRARELLRSCVNEEEWGMYRDLGFIKVDGKQRHEGSRSSDEPAPYAYLIYPHKPIVAYVPQSGRLLSEYCVEFPEVSSGERSRLPASDDVLAKWMALTSDETRVIGRANMHLIGRQLDPARVRRDLWRLSEWGRRRPVERSVEAGAA